VEYNASAISRLAIYKSETQSLLLLRPETESSNGSLRESFIYHHFGSLNLAVMQISITVEVRYIPIRLYPQI
jgi:hypothetical protein